MKTLADQPARFHPVTVPLEATAAHRSLMDTGLFSESGSCYLDFVRALATNVVLVSHTFEVFRFNPRITMGGLGVVLFFLLSGFLITIVGYRRLDRQGNQFAAFMLDRCSRIFVPFVPALICVAIANFVFSLSQHGQMGVNRGPVAFLGNLLLLNDYPVLQALSRIIDVRSIFPRSYNAAEPFWTIPIEFWTYVIFGLFLFGFVRRERIRLRIGLPLLMVAAPVFTWNAFAGGSGVLSLVWVLGAIVGYLWATRLASSPKRASLGALLLAFGGIGMAGRILKTGYDAYELQQDVFIALVVFGAFMILASVDGKTGIIGKAITLLASYSYSLYLVHNTVLVIFHERLGDSLGQSGPITAMIVAHIVAYVFYLLFEARYQAVGRWLKQRLL
jgi:peptidoglycan/LPS O-acetylase OafA/YrhL